MSVRIRVSSCGVKGLNWQREYIVEIKTFLFYKRVKRYDSIEEASDYVKNLTSYSTLVFIK